MHENLPILTTSLFAIGTVFGAESASRVREKCLFGLNVNVSHAENPDPLPRDMTMTQIFPVWGTSSCFGATSAVAKLSVFGSNVSRLHPSASCSVYVISSIFFSNFVHALLLTYRRV